jgi:anti-anti-sigma regulatory factor
MRHAPMLAVNALLLAVIGALESVMNLSTVQQRLDDRGDPNRELLAVGAATVVSGLFGGLPVVYMRLRAIATLNGGGRGRAAVWLGCLLLALTFTIGLPLVELLSTAVIAGVVIALAWTLVDRWTRQLAFHWWRGDRSTDLRRSLFIVAIVALVMVVWGIGAGVAVGVVLAAVGFIRTLNRQVVRNRYSAAEFPSRRVYQAGDEAALAPLRSRVRVLELEGALFFGNADRLAQEAEGVAADTLDLVVDLRRISTIDASGAVALARLGEALGRRGIRLRLAGVRPSERHGRALLAHGIAFAAPDDRSVQSSGLRVYPDLDRAVEAAELHVLAAAAPEHVPHAVALADCRVLAGLSAAQLATLSRHLHERRLAAGERLFGEGEPGLSLYVLTEGSISVVDPRRGQRFATLSPGMCFGETALLDGGGRSADAVADVASVVHELTKDALGQLQRSEPELAAQLYWNLAQHLSERLRAASSAWRREAN